MKRNNSIQARFIIYDKVIEVNEWIEKSCYKECIREVLKNSMMLQNSLHVSCLVDCIRVVGDDPSLLDLL